MLVVDAWMQHTTPEFMAHPMLESLLRWMGLDEPPEEIPLSLTVNDLREGGVDHALISAWHGPEGALLSNDQVAGWVEEANGLFTGIGSVNLHRPRSAVRELRRCVNELGFKGVRVIPWLWELPPNDRRYYPLYAECVELDVPFCLQVGHTRPLKPSEVGRPIPYLDDVLREFPDLTVVGGHIGYPWTEEIIALAHKYPNLYIDTSAYKPSRYPEQFVDYMRESGCKQVLFGTNYPMIQPGECLEELDDLGLDETARKRFLHENAIDVFDLEDVT